MTATAAPAPTTAPASAPAATRLTPLEPVELDPAVIASLPRTNTAILPERAPHWRELDLREILSRPAAFVSIGQSNSVYRPGGVQYAEGHAFRGNLEATVRAVRAARAAGNFDFAWVGYSLFRDQYPATAFDRVQYASWTDAIGATPEQIAWDNTLVAELRELVEPGDKELFETALQSAFVGTDLPGTLQRNRVEVLVFAGVHVDWCIEGNIRAARDNGFLPIVIGDACGAQKPEQEEATFDRINRFFAPVLTTDEFVELVRR